MQSNDPSDCSKIENITPRYEPNIDGLRAIAILSVIAFHYSSDILGGGFAGVDIFFVISGYLIARRYFVAGGQTEHVGDFFTRRLRRLTPALLLNFVVLTSVVLLFYTPPELTAYGQRLTAAAWFYENIQLWRTAGYFDPSAATIELLHYWSLGVEEQWYFLAPLIFIIGQRLTLPPIVNRIAIIIGILSFIMWLYGSKYHPGAAFYLMPTRLWEFMLGALIARTLWVSIPKSLCSIVSIIGLALIIFGMAVLNSNGTYLVTLFVCGGTALLLMAGRSDRLTLVTPFLSYAPLRFVGQISYSLYLWHWPLLVLPETFLARNLTGVEASLALTVCVLISWFSTVWIERPIIDRPIQSVRKEVFCYLGALSVIAFIGLLISTSNGFAGVRSQPVRAASAATSDIGVATPCFDRSRDNCDGLPAKLIVWGDSHAEHWVAGIREASGQMPLLRYGWPGCPPLPGAITVTRLPGSQGQVRANELASAKHCSAINAHSLDAISKRKDVDYVVLAAGWQYFSEGFDIETDEQRFILEDQRLSLNIEGSRREMERLLSNLVGRLRALDKRVILIGDTPAYRRSPTNCINRALMLGLNSERCAKDTNGLVALEWSNEMLRRVGELHGAEVLLPSDILCRSDICIIRDANIYIYHDADHLTASASIRLAASLHQYFQARP